MQQNRALLEKLRQQLRESSIKGDQLRRTIDELVAQINDKEQQLQQLRAELDAKNIHIADLDKTITGLNDNVSSLQEESSKKTETINDQDAQLNTAWFAFGTKRELKDQRIIDGSKVLQSNFNKSYFTKIGKQRILEERIDVGVISPYRAQVQYLRALLKRSEFFKPFRRLITVNTCLLYHI